MEYKGYAVTQTGAASKPLQDLLQTDGGWNNVVSRRHRSRSRSRSRSRNRRTNTENNDSTAFAMFQLDEEISSSPPDVASTKSTGIQALYTSDWTRVELHSRNAEDCTK